MKVKQLVAKLGSVDPNAEIWLESNGAWLPLGKVEAGIMSDYSTKRGTLHAKGKAVLRLQAKKAR